MAFANPFAAAKTTPAKESKKKKNENIVTLPKGEVSEALDEFVAASAKEKEAKADKKVASGVVLPDVLTRFLEDFASTGEMPDTTKFRSHSGKQVTLIVQDRGELYSLSEEQQEGLVQLIGEKKANQMILTTTTFKFNSGLIAKDGVMDVLGHHLTEAIKELVENGKITDEEAADLLEADELTTIRKGSLKKLAALCDEDSDTMENVLDVLGSQTTSYIKV